MRNNHISILSCIIISMATPAFAEEAEDIDIHNLYSFQAELESKLNGTPEENWRYAALLPLKVRFDDGYQYDILKVIDKHNLQEAIPMLEKSLAFGSDYWGWGSGYAAYVWFRLKTDGMTVEKKAEFIASTYQLGWGLNTHYTASQMLQEMGLLGRKHLMAALRKIKGTFTCDNDRIMAFNVPFKLTPKETEEFANSDSYVLMYLAQSYYLDNKDNKAIELGFKMLKHKGKTKYLSVWSLSYRMQKIKGWQTFVTRSLKILRHKPDSYRKEESTLMILFNVKHSLRDYPNFVCSPALIEELEHIANRGSLPLPEEHDSEKLRHYVKRFKVNERASSLLKQIRERQKK